MVLQIFQTGGLQSIGGQQGAMPRIQRDAFQSQENVSLPQVQGCFDRFALRQASCHAAASQGRTTTISYKSDLFQNAVIDHQPKFHGITASSSDTGVSVVFRERAEVAGTGRVVLGNNGISLVSSTIHIQLRLH